MAGETVTGRLVGYPEATLAQIEAGALARINGTITSVAEVGGSYGQSVGEDPWRTLGEVQFARAAAGGTLPPTQTRHDFGGVANSYGSGYYFDPSSSDCL